MRRHVRGFARVTAPLLACAIAGCGPSESGEAVNPPAPDQALFPDTLTLPATAQGRSFRSFLRAYNVGSYDSLYAFARRRVNADSADPSGSWNSFARYWQATHRELGPVRAFTVDTSRAPPSFWVRGTVTGGWSYFRFGLTDEEPPRITGYGVGRGLRPTGAPAEPPVAEGELGDRLHRYLEEASRRGHFSGVALVLRDGEPVFHRGYGTADHRFGTPVDTATRFVIASTAKPLTAVAALQLVARGQLGLEDPVGKHVPEYPEPIASTVAVRHLLTHTSGIELDDYGPYNDDVAEARTVDELLAAQLRHIDHLNQGPLEAFEPSDGFDYTNEGIDLLGVIVQRVSGRDWQETLRRRVLEPAGMTRTGFHRDTAVAGLATGYTRGEDHPRGRRRENHGLISPFARPAGSLFSTAGDLGRFLESLRAGELLPEEWVGRATSARVAWDSLADIRVSYGLGFEVEEKSGLRYFGHSGSEPGVAARMRVYPELGYTTVVLSNYDNAARHVMNRIMEMISEL